MGKPSGSRAYLRMARQANLQINAAFGVGHGTSYGVLGAISASHLLNDMLQSLILAIYPILKGSFDLSFTQIGLITLTYQVSASLLQPLVGYYTDRSPKPFSLMFGMSSTLCGLLLMAMAPNYDFILLAVSLIGIGSSVFHPEASRIARLASGGKHGLAQSIFQVGGNSGSAIGPLLAAAIILPLGQPAIGLFAIAALAGIAILWRVGLWYRLQIALHRRRERHRGSDHCSFSSPLPMKMVRRSVLVLMVLIFSKFFYLTSITSYYTFYLIEHFGVSVRVSQLHLFWFLAAVAAGTLLGGPIGDRYGRKLVIWISILGAAPFTLALPYVNLMWTAVLIFIIGFVLSSAFSAILVYAQEMLPASIGMVSGMFFGFAFGMGGVGAALLGVIAEYRGIEFVYGICAYLPLLGLLTIFLPDDLRYFRQHGGGSLPNRTQV